MSIEVNNITKLYGSQKALGGVSFSIAPGEVVGFLGPNGAGKSTMMKILTCFLPPSSGEASVCGFDVTDQSLEVRQRVGYLPENNPLYTEMYVREYLSFISGLHPSGTGRKKTVADIIDLTGLGPEQHKKIGALSKGYRQRVGLAQALLHDPEVLILDEPTSGLDPNQLVGIRNLIREAGNRKTVLFSTHIMQEVEAICDRVIIIDKGLIVADGSIAAVIGSGRGKQSIVVEFASAPAASVFEAIAAKASATEVTPMIWKFTGKDDDDLRKLIFNFAVEQGLTVLSMQAEVRKLEDVFHRLTSAGGNVSA